MTTVIQQHIQSNIYMAQCDRGCWDIADHIIRHYRYYKMFMIHTT